MQEMSLMERSGLSLNIALAAKPCRVLQLFALLVVFPCKQYQIAISDCKKPISNLKIRYIYRVAPVAQMDRAAVS
jgi:hypothetical protein